jgi:hypothetical protein
MWSRAVTFLRDEGNRALLGWIGGGLVAVIGALWTVFAYFHPAPDEKSGPPQKRIEAICGSVAIGGDVSGTTIMAGSSNNCPKPGR